VAGARLTIAPLTVVDPVTLYVLLIIIVPVEKLTIPPPLILEPGAKTWLPEKFNSELAETE